MNTIHSTTKMCRHHPLRGNSGIARHRRQIRGASKRSNSARRSMKPCPPSFAPASPTNSAPPATCAALTSSNPCSPTSIPSSANHPLSGIPPNAECCPSKLEGTQTAIGAVARRVSSPVGVSASNHGAYRTTPINLKESWRLADIHSQVSSIKVLHGNLRKSNWARN